MANLSFTENSQIIRDLYNTPQEAIDSAYALGITGYRTYLINGETKYVPGSSYIQYEKALRYRVVQGKIGAFGSDTFGDKLVGLQFANSKSEIQGDPYFTLGNFSINKSVEFSPIKDRASLLASNSQSLQNDSVKSFTVQDIVDRNLPYFEGKPYVESLNTIINKNLNISVLFDKRKLDSYVLFSSLKEGFKNCLLEIYNNFPGAIKLNAISSLMPSVSEYISYTSENRASFKINLYGLSNPFGITYTTSGITSTDSETITKYRNFSKTYKDYVVFYNDIEYPIVNITLPTTISDLDTGIRVLVSGDPFGSLINNNSELNANFHIKPKSKIYSDFFENLSDLSSFLLNKDENSGNYVSEFIFPKLSDNGVIVNVKETVFFPTYDSVNIDLFTSSFDAYTTKLNDLAQSYDEVKTNLVSRYLTTDTLKEFDTEDRKINFILQLYGNTFDGVKKYIDGITFMRNVSYNKIENVPDLLVKNYARMLGLKTFEIEDETTLIDSLFAVNKDIVQKGTTPAELDIEIWRRILINSVQLFKSKGTRKSIEFILKLVGLPNEIFELNEYVYLANRKLDVADTLNKIYNNTIIDDPTVLITMVPFDLDGYPTTPLNVKFQEDGNSLAEDKYNIGTFDFGQKYVNEYRKSNSTYLFDLQRTVDNVKSWVYSEITTDYISDNINGYTEYSTDNNKLIINSKELEIYLGSNRIFDLTMYRQYMRNIGVVNVDLAIDSALKFDVSTVTFNQFIQKSLDNFINPKSRKTIKTYPSLSKIYFDYLKSTGTPIDNSRSLEFLKKFDTSWIKLIEQFVPATSVINAGKKVQNSAFLDNKFVYRQGLSDNWLGTEGSEFQQVALRPVYLGTSNTIDNVGTIRRAVVGTIPSFKIESYLSARIVGTDPTINEYLGFYYSIFDYCDENDGRFYKWETDVNYGDNALFFGNINGGANAYGVFVTYENNLYRLNTNTIVSGATIYTTGGTGTTYGLPPNEANMGGVLLWERIPINSDTRLIEFKDKALVSVNSTERSFYMNSIGRALSYLQIGDDYDCPPPKPHVCYFDITGDTIVVNLNTYYSYIDETGISLRINQPKYYGYSLDVDGARQSKTAYGYNYNWTTPYQKRFAWEDGKIYYKGEIIANIHTGNTENIVHDSIVFKVTGDTFTASGSTYPTGTTIGVTAIATGNTTTVSGVTVNPTTISSGTTGGMYGRYEDRVNTDPFMHITPAYIDKVDLDPLKDVYSINLTKSLNLTHIFHGDTPATTYIVNDNIINNELFISDSVNIGFGGFYPLDGSNIGPFYTQKDANIFTHTLGDKLILQPGTDNYVSIESLNENFTTIGDGISLAKVSPGYYLITKDGYLNFNINLYFESSYTTTQSVTVKLINAVGTVYFTDIHSFNGDDITTREFNFDYSGFFKSGEKIYLVINPIVLECTLSRYEKISYVHIKPTEADFSALNDPRFRVLFNSGFYGNGYYGDGLSIKPIYNLPDLRTESLIVDTSETFDYINIPIVEANYDNDSAYLLNKIFFPYYEKFSGTHTTFDTTIYDKKINNDKINFSFKVRSKNGGVGIPAKSAKTVSALGFNAPAVEYTLSFNDYFLGNTPKVTEYSNASNNISIGKKVKQKISNYNRDLEYIPKYSFYNGTLISTGDTIISNNFISYDDGIFDSEQIDYSLSLLEELKNKKRYYYGVVGETSFNYYKLEDNIYNNEVYQGILNSVPIFNGKVINYQLNDIVKVPIRNYKMVVSGATGTTIETKEVYRLYVCINDIHTSHCYTVSGGLTGSIHEIYRPRGSRSCFVEIEKYNPANFTPWGYDNLTVYNIPITNITSYTNDLTIFNTATPQSFKPGEIVLANYSGSTEFFRYIYQKPTVYDAARTYQPGDFVLGTTNYYFSVSGSTGQALTVGESWTPINNTGTTAGAIFNHETIARDWTLGPPYVSGVTVSAADALYKNYCITAARLPKTIPIIGTGNTPYITTGGTGRWDSVLYPDRYFIDTSYTILSDYEVINTNKILLSFANIIEYTGCTNDISMNLQYDNDNYNDFYGTRAGKTNIYLKTACPTTGITALYQPQTLGEDAMLLPLFERLCRFDEKNNPTLWVATSGITTGVTYDQTSLYLGQKYSVNRGELYKYIGTGTTSVILQPCDDSLNWATSDFCLANDFTYYKDRTRVTVYESNTENLTSDVKDQLYFYSSDLILKSDFTNRTFSGTTINNQLVSALNKYYDITDPNRISTKTYGTVSFRVNNGDIIMDYYPDKDEIGFPKTGEFMGRLKISNPCGHVATTFFGLLFNTDITGLDSRKLIINAKTVPETVSILPNIIRVVITQNGASTATAVIKSVDINSVEQISTNVINKLTTFDKKFNIIPKTDLILELTYTTQNNQTRFGDAKIDNTSIFVNDVITNTNTIQTTLDKVQNTEIRTIKLKGVVDNSTIFVNLLGIETVTADVLNPKTIFNIKTINVK